MFCSVINLIRSFPTSIRFLSILNVVDYNLIIFDKTRKIQDPYQKDNNNLPKSLTTGVRQPTFLNITVTARQESHKLVMGRFPPWALRYNTTSTTAASTGRQMKSSRPSKSHEK